MTKLLDQLAAVFREHVRTEKWLLAPTRRVAQQWLDRLTGAGVPVVNARVKTLAGLSVELAADRLVAGGLAPASAAQRRLIVAAAWAAAVDGGGYLAGVRPSPRLLVVAERAVADLRQAGLGPGDLAEGAFEDPRKGRELARLLAAYEDQLARRRLVDRAGAMRLACESVPQGRLLLLVPANLPRSPLERRLVEAFGPRVISLAADEPVAVPRDATVTIARAVGEINELREVLRTCLAERIPLDHVEVVYTAADPYARLAYETAQRVLDQDDSLDLGVPITFVEGVPARLSRPGRLLAAWMSWIAEDFTQLGLLRIIEARLLRPPVVEGRPLGASALARALRPLSIGFGRQRFLPRIDGAITESRWRAAGGAREGEDADAGERAAAAEAAARDLDAKRGLRELAARLLDLTPPDTGDPRALVAAALALVRDHAHTATRLDGLARQHLQKELSEMLEALGDGAAEPPPGFDAAAWLTELPARAAVGGSGPRPGHLHVSALGGGGHTGRPVTFIVGLDDGRFPPAGLQDPLVLDVERRRLGADLPVSAARVAEELEEFGRLLAGLRGRVFLSFAARSVADGRETFASPVVLAAHRSLTGRAEADHEDLAHSVGIPGSFAPQDAATCLDAGEWWMCQGAREPRPAGLPEQLAAAHPNIERGRLATQARESDRFTVFDGLIEDAAGEFDPRRRAEPVSASRLQMMGTCPLRHFYRSVLGIRPPADLAVDPGQWLTPPEFGTLMHEVLYTLVDSLRRDGRWPPEPERDRPLAERTAREALDRWRGDIPPAGEEAYERRAQRLVRAIEIFLAERGGAVREPGSRPLFLEASVGIPPLGAGSALDRAEPVEIALPGGGVILAWARMDRIDALARPGAGAGARYLIIDYKSGGYVKPYDPGDLFDKGRLIQHVLYMAVAQAALRESIDPGAVVEGFTFFFPDVRAHGRQVEFGAAIVPPGLGVIEKLCALAGRGAFPATDDPEDCRFCDYRHACRSVDRALEAICRGTRGKMANDANVHLEEFVELRRDRS